VSDSQSTVRVRSVVLDCPDPVKLASFYAELLTGGRYVGDSNWCEVRVEGMPLTLAFQAVANYRRPEWPDGVAQQVHLDLSVSDLQAASRHAVTLGAEVLRGPIEEPGCVFIVHADPAGHPFCLCAPRTTPEDR
jgi:hypothetical protein